MTEQQPGTEVAVPLQPMIEQWGGEFGKVLLTHHSEQIRDIPKSCICRSWHWIDHRWELLSVEAGCPWHDQAARLEEIAERRLQELHDAAMDEREIQG